MSHFYRSRRARTQDGARSKIRQFNARARRTSRRDRTAVILSPARWKIVTPVLRAITRAFQRLSRRPVNEQDRVIIPQSDGPIVKSARIAPPAWLPIGKQYGVTSKRITSSRIIIHSLFRPFRTYPRVAIIPYLFHFSENSSNPAENRVVPVDVSAFTRQCGDSQGFLYVLYKPIANNSIVV